MQEILGFYLELRGMVSQPPFLIRTIGVRPSKTHRAPINTLYYLVDEAGRTRLEKGERRTANGERRTPNDERKPTVLSAMPLHLYSGHWNNLFRFLITEARSGTSRENANAAEALALLDCRFYHMLRTYDTHCHEYTHTSLPHLLAWID